MLREAMSKLKAAQHGRKIEVEDVAGFLSAQENDSRLLRPLAIASHRNAPRNDALGETKRDERRLVSFWKQEYYIARDLNNSKTRKAGQKIPLMTAMITAPISGQAAPT
jgi:hypothetical protein